MSEDSTLPPKILSLDGPDQVVAGSEITLTWQLVGGAPTQLLLNDQPVEGTSCTVTANDDPTWFTLIASNSAGRTRRRKVVGTNPAGEYVSPFAEMRPDLRVGGGPSGPPEKSWTRKQQLTWDSGNLRMRATATVSVQFEGKELSVSLSNDGFSVEGSGVSVDLASPAPLRGHLPQVTGADVKSFDIQRDNYEATSGYQVDDGYVGASYTATYTFARIPTRGEEGFSGTLTIAGFVGGRPPPPKPKSEPWYDKIVDTVESWSVSTFLKLFGTLAGAAAAAAAVSGEYGWVVLLA